MSHPIIVRPLNIGGKPYALVSGDKRIQAHKILELAEIEAEVRNVDEIHGNIVRLHENLKRTNLAWWDQAALVQTLHQLKQREVGMDPEKPVERGRPKADEPRWGIRDTATELGRALGGISEDLMLAQAVARSPSLRNVTDRRTAVKLARVEARRMTSAIEAAMPTEESYNEAFCGDSVEILKHFKDKTFDHCVSDPPWIKFFDKSLTLDQRTLPVFKEVYRVLKSNSFLLFFCGLDDYHYYCGTDLPGDGDDVVHTKGELERIGFTVSKTPSIWQKESALSRRGVRPWEYDRDFEFVVVAVKGNPTMVHPTAVSSFKRRPIVPATKLIHPNEKPVSVVEDYLQDISYEGNIILDPFGGSFVTAAACKSLGRKWIIIERDRATYEKGCARLGIKV